MGSYGMLWKVPAYPKSIPHLLDHSSFADSVKLWGFCENFISLFSREDFQMTLDDFHNDQIS